MMPIEANYTVLSPKIFDYIAAGNLMALTSGDYSSIPIKNRHYLELQPSTANLSEIIAFSRSIDGNSMRKRAITEILMNPHFHICEYVRLIESKFDEYQSRTLFSVGKSYAFERGIKDNQQESSKNSLRISIKRRFKLQSIKDCDQMW